MLKPDLQQTNKNWFLTFTRTLLTPGHKPLVINFERLRKDN